MLARLFATTMMVGALGACMPEGSAPEPQPATTEVPAPPQQPAPVPQPEPAPQPAPQPAPVEPEVAALAEGERKADPLSFPAPPVNARMSREEAARFLVQASFGPTPESIVELQELGYEQWILKQFDIVDDTDLVARYNSHLAASDTGKGKFTEVTANFYENAIRGEAQLRWRATLALSQIVVVSFADPALDVYERSMAHLLELMRDESLGNYCDFVREVSMRPVMGIYLSSIGNEKANPVKGFAPDENFAREVMQLFTIGLDELNMDGTPTGNRTYTNEDVEGLARVFTGFSVPGEKMLSSKRVNDGLALDNMVGFPEHHEPGAKEFLGTRIDYGAQPEASFDAAMEHILGHRNIAPFIAKQLIQKFILSNPSPAYVRRVAEAFDRGTFRMPSGTVVGEGRRCDMKSTMAAILLDDEARSEIARQDEDYGKVRSTLLRFIHLFRVLGNVEPVSEQGLMPKTDPMAGENVIYNMPFMRAESVFSFYRPQLKFAGSESARRGLVAPEMSLLTTTHIANMTRIANKPVKVGEGVYDLTEWDPPRFVELSKDVDALIDELDVLLTYGTLSQENRTLMAEIISAHGEGKDTDRLTDRELGSRVQYAILTFMTSPEFIVQR